MESLLNLSQLKRIALVGVKHSVESFEKIISYMTNSKSLEEIDLSNQVVPKGSWVKFTRALKDNRSLRNLLIGFNQIIEDQHWGLPLNLKFAHDNGYDEGIDTTPEIPLLPVNQEICDNLKDFIKYNPMLYHLDMQSTRLPA